MSPLAPVEPIRYFVPGPAYVPADARRAMEREVVPHRSAAFREVYDRLAGRLPAIFRTAGEVYLATGSSTLVMEAAIVSLVERDVLSVVHGAFSQRWYDICRSLGRAADRLEVPWGRTPDPDLIGRALERKRYDAVTIVHSETSTGALAPLAEIARVVRDRSAALLLVDAVSSLAGAPLETDAWGLDLVLAGSQKALAAPPGLTVFAVSERAAARAAARPYRGYYTDLLRYRDLHRQGGPITTPAVNVVWALDHQVARIAGEGLEMRWERHRRTAAATRSWADRRGLVNPIAAADRSPTVTCLEPPATAPDAPGLVRRLAERGFTVAGGYGAWKANTFRIGHMGEVRESDLVPLLTTLDELLATTPEER